MAPDQNSIPGRQQSEKAEASDLRGLSMFMQGYSPWDLEEALGERSQLTPEELIARDGLNHFPEML